MSTKLCSESLERIPFNKDVVAKLTKLYHFKGKDFYYEDVLRNEMKQIVNKTIETDVIYATKLLGLKITDARLKSLAKKDLKPNGRYEQIVVNLKSVMRIIQDKGEKLELTNNEFLQLGSKILQGTGVKLQFRTTQERYLPENSLIEETRTVSTRTQLDSLLELYNKNLNINNYEATVVDVNFYVDICMKEIFTTFNSFLNIMILYCLLFSHRFYVFKHISFFKNFFEKKQMLDTYLDSAIYSSKSGFAQTDSLHGALLDMLLEGYDYVQKYTDSYQFQTSQLGKKDQIMSIILKLDRFFTKEEVKAAAPYVSESTVQRALQQLQAEKKIRSDGTGRSAKWERLTQDEIGKGKNAQTDIFDFIGNN